MNFVIKIWTKACFQMMNFDGELYFLLSFSILVCPQIRYKYQAWLTTTTEVKLYGKLLT